jgi:hypothetical protein
MARNLRLFITDNKPALIIGLCIGVGLGLILTAVI